MQSIFRYPGGKTKATVQEWIRRQMPPGTREYREPFVGGGGLFFGLSPSDFDTRWVNDINPDLVTVYSVLSDPERAQAFIARCEEVLPAQPGEPTTEGGMRGGQPVNLRLKEVFDSLVREVYDPASSRDDIDLAFRYFFINRTVFGGRVNYAVPSRLYFSNPEGWNIVNTGRLRKAARHLRGAHVTCGPYRPLFLAPGEGVWIYADPPYVCNSGFVETSQLYQFNFTEDDHRDLAKAVRLARDVGNRVCLSYDDHPLVRQLYPESDGFFLIEGGWSYCGTTNAEKERGKELLILTYEPPSLFSCVSCSADTPAGLSTEEEQELTRLEAEIAAANEAGRGAFVKKGECLKAIREQKLYRRHDSFAAYCDRKHGIKRTYAFYLIKAAVILEHLKVFTVVNTLPTTETQVRHLARLRQDDGALDLDRIAQVWQVAVEAAREAGKEVPSEDLVKQHVRIALGEPAEGRKTAQSELEECWRRFDRLPSHLAVAFVERVRKKYPHCFASTSELQSC